MYLHAVIGNKQTKNMGEIVSKTEILHVSNLYVMLRWWNSFVVRSVYIHFQWRAEEDLCFSQCVFFLLLHQSPFEMFNLWPEKLKYWIQPKVCWRKIQHFKINKKNFFVFIQSKMLTNESSLVVIFMNERIIKKFKHNYNNKKICYTPLSYEIL